MRLKIGDKVKVISGKEKGKIGKVKKILKLVNKVVVEGLNICTKHQKPITREEAGVLVQKEQPLHISNVMLCDANNIASRCRVIKVEKNKERFSKKTGSKIS